MQLRRVLRVLVTGIALSSYLMLGQSPQDRGGRPQGRPDNAQGRPQPANGGGRPGQGSSGGVKPNKGNNGGRPTAGGNNGGGSRPSPGGGGSGRPQPARPNPGQTRPPSRPGRPPQWGRPPQNRPSYSFRPNDRDYLRRHYLNRLRFINRARRPSFVVGGFFPFGDIQYLSPLPSDLYGYLPPPPAGYSMGYFDGYVVVYDPLSYFIANGVDLLQ